ncbi:ribokinase [uncultured Arthrobacter sp.]|uniref:ribokinase n=1 Tax=uncultured Arthrobacter sp. TaxID=114050 RepID=UPI002631BDA9|nr:ribokinase [uncultured Arthrobacter sp.]
MSTGSPGIVVVGSINADLLVTLERHPKPGETVRGRSLTVLPGGKGANQAVAAALLGGQVTMIGAVGSDEYADTALSMLRSAGVDLRAVHRSPGTTGIAVVEVSDDGENTIVVVPGANADVTPGLVESCAKTVAEATVVVVQGELPAGTTETAMRLGSGRIILNLAPALQLDHAVLLRADPLVVNEHEGMLVLAHLGGPEVTDHRGVVEALLECGLASVVMTLGAAGALVSDGDAVTEMPAPRVDAVDTTGAGDAFVGALAVRLAEGVGLEDSVRFAVQVGAYAVQHAGAQPSYPALHDGLPLPGQ